MWAAAHSVTLHTVLAGSCSRGWSSRTASAVISDAAGSTRIRSPTATHPSLVSRILSSAIATHPKMQYRDPSVISVA